MRRLITLSREEMLERWKLMRRMEPLRSDCSVTRTDGIDLDRELAMEMQAWYVKALLDEPADRLPLTELSGEVTVTRAPCGAGMVSLPAGCVRVVSVMLRGWHVPARVVTDLQSAQALAQLSPWARGGCVAPVAVVHPDRLMLYTPPDGDIVLESLLAVTFSEDDDVYRLTPHLLSMITPPNLSDIC